MNLTPPACNRTAIRASAAATILLLARRSPGRTVWRRASAPVRFLAWCCVLRRRERATGSSAHRDERPPSRPVSRGPAHCPARHAPRGPIEGTALSQHPLPSRGDPAHAGLEAAYREHRASLLSALGYLARRGYVVQPADSLEVIHDFFTNQWKAIERNYDRTRGPLRPYLVRAFVRYARDWIIQNRAWTNRLADVSHLSRLAPAAAPDAAMERAELIESVRHVLAALPPDEHTVLTLALEQGPRCERELSRRMGLSRYATRQLLIRAMGRVAVLLGEQGKISDEDWRIAQCLWRDGRTVKQTAAHLDLTAPQVREGMARIGRLLVDALVTNRPEHGA